MPALDINMIESLSRQIHPANTNLMAETEVRTTYFRVILGSLFQLKKEKKRLNIKIQLQHNQGNNYQITLTNQFSRTVA